MDNEVSKPAASPKSKSGMGWAIIGGIVLVIVVLVLLDRFVGVNIFTDEEERQQEKVAEFLEATGEWHAVFLTNGQVYFGQLSNPDAQFALLKDVYYLQLQQVQAAPAQASVDPLDPDAGAQVVDAPVPQPPLLTLIKFGTELHGPEDHMQINRDHILFWEVLKEDSSVVTAIIDYKEGL